MTNGKCNTLGSYHGGKGRRGKERERGLGEGKELKGREEVRLHFPFHFFLKLEGLCSFNFNSILLPLCHFKTRKNESQVSLPIPLSKLNMLLKLFKVSLV